MTKLILSLLLISFISASYQVSYDPATASEMARAAFASYCSGTSLQGMKCGENCNNLKGYQFLRHGIAKVINDETVSYTTFVNPSAKKFIAAFRGTSGNTQLITELLHSQGVKYDLNGVKNAYAGYYFFDAYRNHIRNDFITHMKAMAQKYPDYDFYITGHSLGGALASLAVIDLPANGIANKNHIHLYTFGSPRVGDANMAKAVLDNVYEAWRITHNKDIVPHVPPCNIANGVCTPYIYDISKDDIPVFTNAYHLGQEVYYAQDFKSYRICQGAEDSKCSNQWDLFALIFSKDAFGDHLNYLGVANKCA